MEYKACFVTRLRHLQGKLCNASGLNLTAFPLFQVVAVSTPCQQRSRQTDACQAASPPASQKNLNLLAPAIPEQIFPPIKNPLNNNFLGVNQGATSHAIPNCIPKLARLVLGL
jgi:hypothetical protein